MFSLSLDSMTMDADPASVAIEFIRWTRLRIRTSRTLRSTDDWKRRMSVRNQKFLGGLSLLLFALAFATCRGALVLVSLILALCADFAAVQFASLVLLGFFMLGLRFSSLLPRSPINSIQRKADLGRNRYNFLSSKSERS